MRILLLGSHGQLGSELYSQLPKIGNVDAFSRNLLDITNHQAVTEVVLKTKPNIIINAAAYTAVDKAENNIDIAYAINSEAVANLARLAKSIDAWLIHYSTDYVFNGSKLSPYVETDETSPINVYGFSKLAGEKAIIESSCNYLIFRTTWVIGKYGHNFAKTILKLARERDSLKVISDQVGVPTSPQLITKVTIDAVSAIKKDESWPIGIYHVVPKGRSSWYEISRVLLNLAEEKQIPLKCNANSIQSIQTADYSTPALRPLNSLLDTHKLCSQLSFALPHWEQDFSEVAKAIIKEIK